MIYPENIPLPLFFKGGSRGILGFGDLSWINVTPSLRERSSITPSSQTRSVETTKRTLAQVKYV